MNIEELRIYALSKPEVEEGFPFGEETLVFKTAGKIFLLVGLNHEPLQFNAKCDPERAIELREQYESIIPGYHMNKLHWNTITINRDVSDTLIKQLIDHSYELVFSSLPKKMQSDIFFH